MQTRLSALAALFLVAHLAFLPPTLEDIDSINFAMGVRDFDVARHQPHPPGYPVFIALGKISTPVMKALRVPGAESRALSFWSALFGAALIPLLFVLFRSIDGDDWRAFWAAAFAATSPLIWSNASRPLSDVTGLAFAIAAQALLVATLMGRAGGLALTIGAFLAALATGIRVQTAMLSGPVLLLTFLSARGLSTADRIRAIAAYVTGMATWAVPLIIASGGLDSYITALGGQAGEDFGGVQMLWTTGRSGLPRATLRALLDTFVLIWGPVILGGIVVVIAVGGVLRLIGARAFGTVGLLALLFAPYAVFHLLFHETVTMRYALPLVIPISYLCVRALNGGPKSVVLELAFISAFLVMSVPAMTAFGRNGSPAFSAMRDALATKTTTSAHAGMRRVWEWEGSGTRFIASPHGHEWLGLIDEWTMDPAARIQFLENPRRSDRALIDPRAVQNVLAYEWSFPEIPYVAGARPGAVNRISYDPPGWILDRGWAITAEVAGITERDNYGPHLKPSVAWVRARDGASTLIIGGRHLGSEGDPAAVVTATLGGQPLDEWHVSPGFFFRMTALPAGSLTGSGYHQLSVTAASSDPSRLIGVALEQFDVQPDGVAMSAVVTGWQEPEYSQTTGRAWRWMSEKAAIWVRPIARDVQVTIEGESPLRYFDGPAMLRARVGDRLVGQFAPSADFKWSFVVPAAALEVAAGQVTIESDKWFVPGDRDRTADRRHLALRVYSLRVE